jgi:hypothetical protein
VRAAPDAPDARDDAADDELDDDVDDVVVRPPLPLLAVPAPRLVVAVPPGPDVAPGAAPPEALAAVRGDVGAVLLPLPPPDVADVAGALAAVAGRVDDVLAAVLFALAAAARFAFALAMLSARVAESLLTVVPLAAVAAACARTDCTGDNTQHMVAATPTAHRDSARRAAGHGRFNREMLTLAHPRQAARIIRTCVALRCNHHRGVAKLRCTTPRGKLGRILRVFQPGGLVVSVESFFGAAVSLGTLSRGVESSEVRVAEFAAARSAADAAFAARLRSAVGVSGAMPVVVAESEGDGTVADARMRFRYGITGDATVRDTVAITSETSRAEPEGCCAPYQ